MRLDHLLSMEKRFTQRLQADFSAKHNENVYVSSEFDYPEHVDKRIQGSDEVKEQVTKEHTGNARGIWQR